MKNIENQTFDAERALYALHDAELVGCTFEGEADGESALKESCDFEARGCRFALRYPLWHDSRIAVRGCTMTDTCRAPVWYTKDALFEDCKIDGVKAFRECDKIKIQNCRIVSPEFGWNCRGMEIQGGEITSEYFLLGSSEVLLDGVNFTGKYSFQYVKNAEIHNAVLQTKDAFWHTENVSVYDSVISGEYLAWYSKNLRLYRCRISGTQPLCYAENLYLEDCTMEGCDLSFENTSVTATVKGSIDSVKNPISGRIEADSIGEIILDENLRKDADCKIVTRKNNLS